MLLKKIFWFWKKNSRFARQKKINILALVLSEKKILNETKNHNLPFKLNGRSLSLFPNPVMLKQNLCVL